MILNGWYGVGMDEELRSESIAFDGEPLKQFFMYNIVVDGIPGSSGGKWPGDMFTIKDDCYKSSTLLEDSDGYIDDRQEVVCFQGAYSPVSYSLGEIDERFWLASGIVDIM